MASLLSIYHHFPYPLRVLVASIHGYRINLWRYSKASETLCELILERESWSPEKWKSWQDEQLAFVLDRAVKQVPFYREFWYMRRRNRDNAAWDILANWPVLKKDDLRDNPRLFVADDCNISRMSEEHTSGSSGKPLTLWRSKKTDQIWYALFEARVRLWNKVSRHHRWAIIGGRLVTPYSQNQPPYWVWNAGLNQLYLSAYHLSQDSIPAYLAALSRYQINHMVGYPSALYTLAQATSELHLDTPGLQVIISNAEPLYDHQRELISRVFHCRVVDTYGQSEISAAASECEIGSMHLWPEVGLLEVVRDDEDALVDIGQEGRFLQTGLLNTDMPLIRYEVGDRGSLRDPLLGCPCGRTLPIIDNIEGRLDDLVITPDGRKIGRLDPVFKADFPIREAQIIQESLETLCVKIIPAPGYTSETGEKIAANLRDRVGEVQIKIELVGEIPRSSNGKFRAVISNIKNLQPQDRVKDIP